MGCNCGKRRMDAVTSANLGASPVATTQGQTTAPTARTMAARVEAAKATVAAATTPTGDEK